MDLVIDIETRPNPELVANAEYWQEVASKLTPPAHYKDPLKIEEWRTKELERCRGAMALTPWHGVIVQIGFCSLDQKVVAPEVMTVSEVSLAEERKLLKLWCMRMDKLKLHRIYGWCVRDFDVPFIIGRLLINGIAGPTWFPHSRRYDRVIDLRDVLGSGHLEDWMVAMGLGPKKFSGPDVLSISLPELAGHCRDDIVATATMADRLQWVAGLGQLEEKR